MKKLFIVALLGCLAGCVDPVPVSGPTSPLVDTNGAVVDPPAWQHATEN